MSTVRRIVVPAIDSVELVEEPAVAALGRGEARVRSVYVGVCGSDTHAVKGEHPFISLPYHPGHEVVGVVVELAPDVDSPAVGTRVVAEPTLPCGHCKQCRAGEENLCENLDFFGCGAAQGGMADEFVIPAGRLHAVPDRMSDLAAALIEPLSTPVHAGRLAGPLTGRAVGVLGSGTIGLLMQAVARYSGARVVLVSDPDPAKRERAERLGADATFDAASPTVVADMRAAAGESLDVVFDCVAVQSTVDAAIELVRKNGTVVVVGVPSRDVTVPLPVMQNDQIRLQGSATYLPRDYVVATAMIAEGFVRPEDFVTATFPLERAADAFAAALSGREVKVLVEL